MPAAVSPLTRASAKPVPGALSARREKLLLAALLSAMFLQQFCSARLLNSSSDETMHLPSGYTYWRTGDFRLNPEHPPLIKLLAAAPLLLMDLFVKWDDPTWQKKPPDQVRFGVRFLYSNNPDRLLFWARLPVMLLSLLLAFYVFRWARDLYGPRAGLLALFLCAFCPTIIGHGRFVTMDVGLSCFYLITLYYVWRFTTRGGIRNVVGAGIALGLALATKFSAVFLLPSVVILLAAAALYWRRPDAPAGTTARLASFPDAAGRGPRLLLAASALALMTAIAFFLVWAIFFFPRNPFFYVEGMLKVNENHVKDYWSYLAGQFKQGGWWYYFLACFLFKTPVPTLVLLCLAVVSFRKPPLPRWENESFLVVPAVLLFIFTSSLADDIGVRYILPVYPLVFVLIGRVADGLFTDRAGRAAAAVLCSWLAIGTVRMYPDYLAFFNEIVGGPEKGYDFLDDSNIEWGADLKRLKAYLDENGIESVKLYTPWSALPGYYGIKFEWFEFLQPNEPPPGIYAISTHTLVRGILAARIGGQNTDWLHKYKPIARIGYGYYIFKFE